MNRLRVSCVMQKKKRGTAPGNRFAISRNRLLPSTLHPKPLETRQVPNASILLAAFTILAGVLLAAIAVGLSVYDALQKPQEATLETLDDLKAFCGMEAEPVEFTREGSGLLPLPLPPNPAEYVDGPP